jgi:hypothetical protein
MLKCLNSVINAYEKFVSKAEGDRMLGRYRRKVDADTCKSELRHSVRETEKGKVAARRLKCCHFLTQYQDWVVTKVCYVGQRSSEISWGKYS